jgi:hypothetical protein
MKRKLLLFTATLATAFSLQAQVTIYDTTHDATNGGEITPTANGLNTSYGDAIQLAGTERQLDIISVNLFNLTDTSDITLTMTLYSDCPTLTGTAACGSGTGTLIPFSENIVLVKAPPITGQFVVDFEYNGLDITDFATDNTITVMLRASRNNVFWIINESPVIGSTPAGDTPLSTVTRCGSTAANNGCNRAIAAPTVNNLGMKITALPNLSVSQFSASDITISPNPATNIISIASNQNIGINAIEISDLNGRVVQNQSFENVSSLEMNIANIASGVYLLTIVSDKGSITKKIVKN